MSLSDIQAVVDEQINPLLKLHNGSCQLLSLTDNLLSIRLTGGCIGCPSSTITLYNGIIPIIHEKFPDVEVVLA